MSLGIAGGIGGVVSGFWVKQGYVQPVAATGIATGLALLLMGFLRDSAEIKAEKRKKATTLEYNCDAKDSFSAVDETSSSSTSSLISHDENSMLIQRNTTSSRCNQLLAAENEASRSYTVFDLLRSVWRVYSSDYSHCVKCYGPVVSKRNINPKAGIWCINFKSQHQHFVDGLFFLLFEVFIPLY